MLAAVVNGLESLTVPFLCTQCGQAKGTLTPEQCQGIAVQRVQQRKELGTTAATVGSGVGHVVGRSMSLSGAALRRGVSATLDELKRLPGRTDRVLKLVSGEGNDIIHWFLRILTVVVVAILSVVIMVNVISAVGRAVIATRDDTPARGIVAPSMPTAPGDTHVPLIPYSIITSELQPPLKCSYYVRVDFVGNRLPTEDELAAVSRKIKSDGPRSDNVFVLFYMPGENPDDMSWATAHHTPNLRVSIVRTPTPRPSQQATRFGLSLDQRKRYWFETLKTDEPLRNLPDSVTIGMGRSDPNSLQLYKRLEEQAETEKAAIRQRWGLSEDEAAKISIEALHNQWPLLTGAELDRAINHLPGPSRH
jgi:hypothetical protein